MAHYALDLDNVRVVKAMLELGVSKEELEQK